MLINNRPDGTLLKPRGFLKLMPHWMPTRTEAVIFFEQHIDVTETMKLIDKLNAEKNIKMTFFHVFISALIRVLGQRPKLNRFINNRRYYQRNNISVNFVAKKELNDESEEVNVTEFFSPFESLLEVSNHLSSAVKNAKSSSGNVNEKDVKLYSAMPHFLLRFIFWGIKFLNNHNMLPANLLKEFPFFCTIFVANIGSIGIDAPFHHNFELGTTGLFAAIGKISDEYKLSAEGKVELHKMVKINYTSDDRVVDGIYCAKALNMIKDYIENPEKLLEKIELSDKELSKLMLKGYMPEDLAKNS